MTFLILPDLSTPEVSGYDFLKMSKQLNIERVPIIVISAYNLHDSIASIHDMGAVDLLKKLINIDTVLEIIKAALTNNN